jgi:hypothetical protein
LSLSLSSVVGQNASLPNLLLNLFTGGPSLSTALYALSKPTLPPVFTRSHSVAISSATGVRRAATMTFVIQLCLNHQRDVCLFQSRVYLFLHNDDTILLAPQPAEAGQIKRLSTVSRTRLSWPYDDIRVETFCRNRAASALPLIAFLPLPWPPLPCKSPGHSEHCTRGRPRHTVTVEMTSTAAADAKHGAVCGVAVQARCGGGFDSFCQRDEKHRDGADARHGAANTSACRSLWT